MTQRVTVSLPDEILAEASRRVPEHQASGVSLLVEHPYAVVTSSPAADWRALAEWSRILGRVDVASALFDAITHTGYVLTSEPDVYGDHQDLPVIPFD